MLLTLLLLRAYTTAHSGQRTTLTDDVRSCCKVSTLYVFDKRGYVDGYGATLHTRGIGTVETANSLLTRLSLGETTVDLFC